MEDFQVDTPEEINTGAKLYPKDIIGHMLLIWAIDYIPHSPTQFNDGSDPNKPCDVVVVDVVDLDQVDPETGQIGLVSRGSWWRQGRLIQRLRPRVGMHNPLLMRMAKGLGANGAFELVDLSFDQNALGRAKAWWANSGGHEPTQARNGASLAGTKPTQVAQASAPPPPPSPLEQQANAAIGINQAQQATLERLRRLGQPNTLNSTQSDTPPF